MSENPVYAMRCFSLPYALLVLSVVVPVQSNDQPVFYAQTANYKKEVEICIVSPSVSYSFGKVGVEKKEMDIFVPANRTSFASQSHRFYSISVFTIRNGDTIIKASSD